MFNNGDIVWHREPESAYYHRQGRIINGASKPADESTNRLLQVQFLDNPTDNASFYAYRLAHVPEAERLSEGGLETLLVPRNLLEKIMKLAEDTTEPEIYNEVDEILNPEETVTYMITVTGKKVEAQMEKIFTPEAIALFKEMKVEKQ